MRMNQYQVQARAYDKGTKIGDSSLAYLGLGVSDESGEVAGKIKKLFRDKKGEIDEEFRIDTGKELGDVLWYVSRLADELSFTLEEIASMNIDKLSSRESRGVIGGEGDDR